MENPLAKLVEIDEREDGVYMKVSRAVRSSIQAEALDKVLMDAMVANYDSAVIRDVFNRSRNVFEKIGPPFEYYDIKFDSFISIGITPMRAVMKVSAESVAAGMKMTESLLRYALKKRNVSYGIKKDALQSIINSNLYNRDIVVAEGVEPEKGMDGKTEFEKRMDPDSTPKVDKRGKVNYRDITSFVSVKKGEIIARRIPPKPGKSGFSISGEEIPSEPGKDIRLPAGRNTDISTDGMSLIAQKDGVIFWQSGLICVGELLNIQGNVDFSVGNIKYTGDVYIRGNVMPGFVIESEGNIEIMGEVESAKIISRKGFVTINKGVIGKNDTEIYGEKGVSLHFAQECVIKTDGVLTVEKHLLHCTCTCAVFEAVTEHTAIIGGSMVAFQHVESVNIGNENHVKTDIFLVDKNQNKQKEKYKELLELKDKTMKQMEPISRELRTKTSILKRAGTEVTARHQQELKKVVDAYNDLNLKVKYIETKIEEVVKEMKSPANLGGYVKVKNTVYAGSKIDMYGLAQKIVQANMTKKTFKIRDNNIHIEG